MIPNRLLFIEGLRGLLAVVVFLHHFFYMFYPQFIFGGFANHFSDTSPFSMYKILALTPINSLFNPALAIHLFFLLSGYIQSRNYFLNPSVVFLKQSLLKRYIRLALPTLAVLVIVFICHQLNCFQKSLILTNPLSEEWLKALLPDNLNFLQIVKHGLLDNFISNSNYYQVLWTMPIELINSYFILLLLLVTHSLKRKPMVFVAILIFQLIFLHTFYAAAFTIGVLISYSEIHFMLFLKIVSNKMVHYVFFIVGIYLASYPFTAYQNTLSVSMYYPIVFLEHTAKNPSYLIGTVLLFCFLLNAQKVKIILSNKVFVLLGKVSFMFYLIHFVVLLSLSAISVHYFSLYFSSAATVIISLSISFFTALMSAYLLFKWVDKPILNFCNRNFKRVIK